MISGAKCIVGGLDPSMRLMVEFNTFSSKLGIIVSSPTCFCRALITMAIHSISISSFLLLSFHSGQLLFFHFPFFLYITCCKGVRCVGKSELSSVKLSYFSANIYLFNFFFFLKKNEGTIFHFRFLLCVWILSLVILLPNKP